MQSHLGHHARHVSSLLDGCTARSSGIPKQCLHGTPPSVKCSAQARGKQDGQLAASQANRSAGTSRQPGRPPAPNSEAQQPSPTRRPKRSKEPKVPKPKPLEERKGCCYGCGVKLQVEVPLAPGYVTPEKFETKLRHKQLDKLLCARCAELCNGAMVPAVEDFTQKLQAQAMLENNTATPEALQLLGKALITPEQLRSQLKEVALKRAIVVLLVDLTDASGTLMTRVRDMVGRNPIILVGTKMDLLPDGTHPKSVATWLEEAAARKGLNVISCHLVSAHTGDGVSIATGKVLRERKGRDVYVVGAANVGKSAFVRAMLKDMGKYDGGNYDPAAMATGKYLPVESPMPGTTLGLIALKAFASGGVLFDTPGVHLFHRVQHMLSPTELKLLHPRKRLSPILPPAPITFTANDSTQAQADRSGGEGGAAAQAEPDWSGAQALLAREKETRQKSRPVKVVGPSSVAASYNWSDLVRIDVIDAPPTTALAFYGPSSMRVKGQSLDSAPLPGSQPPAVDKSVELRELGGSSRVLACRQSVEARGGLVPHMLQIKTDGSRGPLADIAISGVPGWASVWAPGSKKVIRLRVWVPKGVQVFLRPPLPCASPFKAGGADDAEVGDEFDGRDLGVLAAEYEGGAAASAINDASWWEAAIAELEAFEGELDEDDEFEFEEEEEEVEEAKRRRGRRAAGSSGERIIMQATVEDILKRPRLDIGFDDLEEEEEEGEDQEGGVSGKEDQDVGDEDGEADSDVGVTPVRRPRLGRAGAGYGTSRGLRGRRGLGK